MPLPARPTRDRSLPAATLTVLPVLFVASALVLRHHGGPFWIWHLLDPSYYYLFDSLNLALGQAPGHPYHPGTPVQVLGALILRAAHPLAGAAELTRRVLDAPEAHLALISTTIVVLVGLGLLASGLVAWRATGRLLFGLVMQAGPFLSMVILKDAYHVKPEPLLILATLALGMLALDALRPGARPRPVAFGIVAGFGVATKLTAAPIFALPLLLLGRPRPIGLYVLAAAVALAVFTLPSWPSLGKFVDFASLTLSTTGAYGQGEAGFIDPAAYGAGVLNMLKRPVVHVPLLLSLLAVGAAWRRPEPMSAEARLLAGLALALAAQVLAVAKQPNATYMIPAYMLAPLAIVLLWREIAAWNLGGPALRHRTGQVFTVLLLGGLAAQAFSVVRLDRELADWRRAALDLDESRFAACNRLYFFPASTPNFALPLADWWTGMRFSDAVAARLPKGVYWYEHNTRKTRDAHGTVSPARVAGERPCLMLRGGERGPMNAYVTRELPEAPAAANCSTADETVFVLGADCSGNLTGNGR